MALTRYKLGDLIDHSSENNSDLIFGLNNVKGISIKKVFIETKADMQGVPLNKYLLVKPDYFAYVTVTSRNGEKITLAHNTTKNTYLVSSTYEVFKVKDPKILNSDYLFMFFNRFEFDRYSRFNSWGSAREVFSWEDMCDIDIDLPDLPTQQKYVDIYNGMMANQKSYEYGLDDILLVLCSYFDTIKNLNLTKLSDLIDFESEKNFDNSVDFSHLRGINELGEFCCTRDSINEEDISKYLIVKDKSFAVNFMCLGNFGKFYCAYNDSGSNFVVSPACNSFKIVNNKINPYFLLYTLRRPEFQRKCVVIGDGNTRGGINITDFKNLNVPVPEINVQKTIVDLYKSFESRRKLNVKLKEQIKNICPILIKASIEEAKRSN